MNSKRSYLDSLNAGRQRRPSTALEQISRTLEELERRLDRTVDNHERMAPAERERQFARSAAEPAPAETTTTASRTMPEPASLHEPSARDSLHSLARQYEITRQQEDQHISVGRIADELKGLREELRETMAADLHSEFGILRSEMRRMGAAMNAAPYSSELGLEFERLSDAIGALAGRSDDRSLQMLRLELEQMRSEMNALAREETVRSVGAQRDPAIDALNLRVEEIGEAISKLPDSRALDSLEEKVRALATALDHLLGHADDHSSDLYRLIDERLDEISRAIAASFSAERPYSIDPEPFERIEARISSLSKQIEELVEDRSAAGIADRLDHLSDRIDHIGQRIELPEKAVEQLARQMMLIADKLDGLGGAPDAAPMLRQLEDGFSALAALVERQRGDALDQEKSLFRELEKRIDAIAEKIGHGSSADEAYPDLLAAIDARFAELSARLDATAQPADDEPFRMLEERLEDISRRLQDSALPGTGTDPELLRKLETQVANLSAHLADPVARLPELDDLGPRLADIERSIVDNRDAIFDAARKAAQEAIDTLKGTPLGDTTELAEEVKALEKLARRADDRNTRTFEAIHDTLLKIVDRLSLIENGSGPVRDEEDRPAAKLAIESAPSIEPNDEEALLQELDAAEFGPLDAHDRDDPTRSPAEAAAAAAIAALNGETRDRRAPTRKRSMLSGLTRALRKEQSTELAPKLEPDRIEERPEPAVDVEIDASILNEPLEPGSGAPDLNAIIRRVRDENGPHTRQAPPDAAKSDFIAAARRAAQAAAAEADAVKKKQTDARGTSNRFGLGQILRSRKSMALMAVAGIAIVAGGMQVSKVLAPFDGETTQVAQEAEPVSTAGSDRVETAEIATAEPQEASLVAAAKLGEEAEETAPVENTVFEDTLAPSKDAEAPAADAEVAAIRDLEEAPALTAPAAIEIPAEAGPAALREAAAADDPKAFFEIGNRYADGRGLEADMAKAAEWYGKAAAAGLAPAQYRIGNFYEKGTGIERDIEKAKTWYQLAAEQGNASAMHNLGVLFAMGADGTADNESAARWFQGAAELGVQDSQFNLGILYAKGIGVERDLEESYKWFALVADKGDGDAAAKREEIAGSLGAEQLERAKAKAELWKPKPLDREANTVDIPADWNDSTTNTAGIDPRQAVASIQHILNESGYGAGPADGVIGQQTKSAIMAFQEDHGLDATGDVNEKLVRTLFEKK